MPGRSQVTVIRVYPLAIPMRQRFKHAAHERSVADPLVIEVELADGTLGYGETLPRPYVSGETAESAVAAIRDVLAPELVTLHPASFALALERIDALPSTDEAGKVITAARAGVELALLDAYSRHFEMPISEAVGWLGLPGLGEPGSVGQVRYSGIISGGELRKVKWSARKMRWFGLRDFKLKVGYVDDVERVRAAAAVLGLRRDAQIAAQSAVNGPERGSGGGVGERGSGRVGERSGISEPRARASGSFPERGARGDAESQRAAGTALDSRRSLAATAGRGRTLRLDANAAWSFEDALGVLADLQDLPIACIEQPLAKGSEERLVALKRAVSIPIMHDESLVTHADAERLIEMGVADVFNIRISKNGGFLAAMRMAALARKHGVAYQLGCMVGETSILSAAGRRFIENMPGIAFAEGSYGRFLLSGDIAQPAVRFGYGGHVRPQEGLGWGVTVLPEKLREFAAGRVVEIRL
jgi:L-alanine-DL-glutamate epimerase-like enolase superfamily enzyme